MYYMRILEYYNSMYTISLILCVINIFYFHVYYQPHNRLIVLFKQSTERI